jgi:hypothetical protein
MGTHKGKHWDKTKTKKDKDRCVSITLTIEPATWRTFTKMYKGNRSKLITEMLRKFNLKELNKYLKDAE